MSSKQPETNTSRDSKISSIFQSLRENISRLRFSYSHNNLDKKALSKLAPRKIPKLKQLKYIPSVLSQAEKRVIKYTSLVAVIALGFFFYASFFANTTEIPKQGGEYVEGLVGRPLYINPLLAQTNDVDMDLSRLVFNGLVRYDENYNIIPDLASDWQISEDQKTYTFTVRDNVTWHDGNPLTANDIYFTYQLIKDPSFKSPLNRTFEGVTAEITGENQISFYLEEPYAGFLDVMTFGILPQHLWYDIPSANSQLAKLNQKPIGTGPYKFKSLVKEQSGNIISYTFEVHENYHLQTPFIENLQFKFYPDIITAVEALKNKNVQGLGFLPKGYREDIAKRDINIHEFTLSQFTAVFFNQDANELLEDDTVREALTLATNKQAILTEILNEEGNIIHTPVLPGFIGFDEELINEYKPTQAAELLVADGWQMQEVQINSDGTLYEAPEESEDDNTESQDTLEDENESDADTSDVDNMESSGDSEQEVLTREMLVKDDQPLVITLTTVNQSDSVKLVELIQRQWGQIGVHVLVDIVPRENFATTVLPQRSYEALAYGGIIGYNADLFPFWHSSQRESPGVNLSNYVNRKVDTLIEEIRRTSDIGEQEEKLKELQGIIFEERPAIFLYSPTYSYPVSSKVKGISIDRINLPSDRFWNINQWYIKTKKFFK